MPHLKPKARSAHFSLTPVAVVACALIHGGAAHAQAQPSADAPLQLKPSPMLREDIPPAVGQQLPTFVTGDTIRGTPDLETGRLGRQQQG